MPGCSKPCELETVSQDPEFSPGPVQDHEPLSRGLFDPSHGKPGNIRNTHLPKKDLLARKLSVWRTSDVTSFTIHDLRTRLASGDNGGALFAIASVQTGDVRDHRIHDNPDRVLCVRDECDVDHEGNKHPAHAHIALCNSRFPDPVDVSSEDFVQTWRDLCLMFKNNQVWP